MVAREKGYRAFGQCLDLKDLSSATSEINVINVTDEIPRARKLDHDSRSVGARAIDLDQAREYPKEKVCRRALKEYHRTLVVIDQRMVAHDFIDKLCGNPKLAELHFQAVSCFAACFWEVHELPRFELDSR